MVAIAPLAKDFDGADGAAATAAAIGATGAFAGAGISTFNAAHAVKGATCWAVTVSSNTLVAAFAIGSSKTNVWDEFYGTTPSALPGAAVTLGALYGDSNANLVSAAQWMPDGGIRLRDNITSRGTSTDNILNANPVPPNTPYRIELKGDPGGTCQIKLYIGTNQHGTTPDWDSGAQANTSSGASGVDFLRLGVGTNATGTFYFDYNRADDTTPPDPAVTVAPPTVDVGTDLTKDVSSGTFNIVESETLVGGATVSSRVWTQDSGPTTLTLSGTTTNTVTVTAPATTGTYVLRCTVTDSNSQVGFDTVTIAFVVPGVALVPVGDVSNVGAFVNQAGSSSNLWQSIDDGGSNLADFITTPQTPTAASYKSRITPAVEPGNQTGCVLLPTVAITADATSYSFVYKVYDGDGTLKKTFAAITTGLSTTPTPVPLSFTAAEIASFAHWDSGIIVERLMTVS